MTEEPEPETGSITIQKEVSGDGAPEEWSFDFESDILDFSEFTLTNGTTAVTIGGLETGEYNVAESDLPENWSFAGIDCGQADAEIDGRTAIITLGETEEIICIFTNDF